MSFDIAGVLVLPDPALVLPDARADEDWDAVHYLVRVRHEGTEPSRPWEEIAAVAKVTRHRLDEYLRALHRVHADENLWTRPVPGALQVIRRLRRSGLRLLAISNTVRPMAHRILMRAGLADSSASGALPASCVFDSAVIGYSKPDPQIFHAAFNAVGVAAHEVVHIGDSHLEDVLGAARAGAHPLHLTPYGVCETLDQHTDVGSLFDAEAHIRSIQNQERLA